MTLSGHSVEYAVQQVGEGGCQERDSERDGEQRPHALSAVLASVLNAFMAALSVKMPTTCCRGWGVSFLPPCLPMSLATVSRRLSVAARSLGTFTRNFTR